jgi:hypothetical protein
MQEPVSHRIAKLRRKCSNDGRQPAVLEKWKEDSGFCCRTRASVPAAAGDFTWIAGPDRLEETVTFQEFDTLGLLIEWYGNWQRKILFMLELRKELQTLIVWNYSASECHEQTQLDAVAHRIMRMAELIREIREITARN